MPIRPEYRALYHGPEYRERRRRIVIERARLRCEHCGREHGTPYLNKRNKWVTVQLGVAHLNMDPLDNDEARNLRALCRACHLAWDREFHKVSARVSFVQRKDAARPLLAEAQA